MRELDANECIALDPDGFAHPIMPICPNASLNPMQIAPNTPTTNKLFIPLNLLPVVK
jgi:hypothetical protein